MNNRNLLKIIIAVVLVSLLVVYFSYSFNRDNSVTIISSELNSQEEKINRIKHYIEFESDVLGVEYIFNLHSGSMFALGPSDMSLEIALRVLPSDVPKWTKSHSEITAPASAKDWNTRLRLTDDIWKTQSDPHYYSIDANTWMAVFTPEGIIYRETFTR